MSEDLSAYPYRIVSQYGYAGYGDRLDFCQTHFGECGQDWQQGFVSRPDAVADNVFAFARPEDAALFKLRFPSVKGI